ncbi:tripartite tricarboxylate transporter TctB family protein [Halobacillus sp. Marseille-P3879]|uniref:tripartite tricarboxylate transporter TctB family protein n=1 Tax=Halobacillus sp. Marseille-P3879 TaxID=2045014 RepID=UPI000C7A5BDF|nr:tripartite tricarboxylate transporter TctB family protein [Halobacillus sp. Marseille-P3879]
MKDLLTLEMSYSEYHLIFPKIVLIALGITILMLIGRFVLKFIRERKGFISMKRLLSSDFNRLKFFASLGLLFVYPLLMNGLGFVISTVIFMIVLTLILMGRVNKKALMVSVTNSLTTTIVVWYVFGRVFDITLP